MAHTTTLLVGIDDTDNLDSPGTGFRARDAAALMGQSGLAGVAGITRHQLLVSPLIPYTSHNSSACLRLVVDPERVQEVVAFCRDYLLRESASGSDAGLCVAPERQIDGEAQRFGYLAKRRVLTQEEAWDLAARQGIVLEGLTGTGDGIIGALAAGGRAL